MFENIWLDIIVGGTLGAVPLIIGILKKQVLVGILSVPLCIVTAWYFGGLPSFVIAGLCCWAILYLEKNKRERTEEKRLAEYKRQQRINIQKIEDQGIKVILHPEKKNIWPPVYDGREEE